MLAVDDLIYIVILALVILILYLGSRLFKGEDNSTIIQNKKGSIEILKNVYITPKLDGESIEKELNLLKGRRIEKVFYINYNYPFYEFEEFDSIDFGVIFKLEGDRYLNWVFNKGFYDLERDESIHPGYYLDFSNLIEKLTIEKPIFEVSEDKKWRKIINSTFDKFELKRIDYEGNKICEKLIIETGANEKVGIFSTDQPAFIDEHSIQVNLNFEVDWITVVFDQELLSNE